MSGSYRNCDGVTEQEVCALLAGLCGGLFIFTMYDSPPIITLILIAGTIRFIIGAWFNYDIFNSREK